MYTKLYIYFKLLRLKGTKVAHETNEIDTYCHTRRVYPDRHWPLLLFSCAQSLDPDQQITDNYTHNLITFFLFSQRDQHKFSFFIFYFPLQCQYALSQVFSFSCSHLPFSLHTIHRLWWVMLITHPSFVSMLPLWCVHFKIFIVMETIPIFICLKHPLKRMRKVGVSD